MDNTNDAPTIILNRGDYTSLTINLFGGKVTSWRIQNREQLFVSRTACFSHLAPNFWNGIGICFPHFKKWNFGPIGGFAKNMMWSLETGPHYLENGDVWATFFLKDDCYSQAIWNYRFMLRYTIILHEFKISFDISVENYDYNFAFLFNFMQRASFRTPDIKNSEIRGLKNALYRINYKDDDNADEVDILKLETRDVIHVNHAIDTIYTRVNKNIEVSNLVDNGNLKIMCEGSNDVHLWNPWTNSELCFIGTVLKV